MSAPAVLPETDVEEQQQTKRQPPYHVVLINDDDHTYQYVIEMLKALFGHPVEKGYQLAKIVDTKGRAIVCTTTLERAELKRDQIHAYGPDPRIDRCKGAMTAEIEPAE
jgi:ATP-dependent Clp protease adaptor protein ClpS